MRVSRRRWLAALVACVISVGCLAADEGLLLYSAFDGEADATLAEGDGTARSALEPVFRPGISGQALLIGGTPSAEQEIINGIPVVTEQGRNVYYESAGNFDYLQGSLSMWVKPLDWDASTKGFNVLFHTGAGENYFQLYKFFSNERLNFYRGLQNAWPRVKHEMRDWLPGEWQHIVATWSEKEVRLFMNGHLVSALPVRDPSGEPTPVQALSIGPGNAWEKAFSGQSLVDELRIYDRPLSQPEIVKLYREHADQARRTTGLLTIGQRTPTLDGEVQPYEYSLTDSDFLNVQTGMASALKNRYSLSYDETTLYLGYEGATAAEGDTLELVIERPGADLQTIMFSPEGSQPDGLNMEQTFTASGWTLEAAIPFTLLDVEAAPDGEDWRVNIGRRTADKALSAAPAMGIIADRASFLTLAFRPQAPAVRIAGIFDLVNHISAADYSAEVTDPTQQISIRMTHDNTYQYGLQSRTRMLVEDGRATPFRAPIPPHGRWPLEEFGLNELEVLAEAPEAAPQPLYHRRLTYQEDVPLSVQFLYTQNRRQVVVTARKQQEGAMRLRFFGPDGEESWQIERPLPAESNWFQLAFPIDFSQLPPAVYNLHVEYVSADGASEDVWQQDYQVPSIDTTALQPYTDPEAGTVPAPWTPMTLSGTTVGTWGRTHDLGDSLLVRSLRSQGQELLAGPPVLRLAGEVMQPTHQSPPLLTSRETEQVVHEKTTEYDAFLIRTRLTTSFDGYCDVEMTLVPREGAAELPSLALDFPLVGELATLVRDNRHNFLIGGKSGAVGDYWAQRLVDEPFFWVGNEDIGFNWLARDLRAWHSFDAEKNVEIIREGEVATVRLNLIDRPLTLEAPRTFRFGFSLTPSRPLDLSIKRLRAGKDFQKWVQPWEDFAVLDYEGAKVAEIERASADFPEAFIYQGDGLTSPFMPEWAFWEEEWRLIRPGHGYGQWTGNSKVRWTCYTTACIASETFRNWLNHMRADFYEKAKTPLTPKAINYYFDTGIGASTCENHHHGCRLWTDSRGQQHGALNIDAYRQLSLDVYRMIRRTGPDAKIMSHQGFLRAMPLQHFTDMIVGGEGIVLASTHNYNDHITPAMFRATFLADPYGIKMLFLNMLVRAAAQSPERLANFATNAHDQQATRHFYGYCMAHDTDWWDSHRETAEVRQLVWQAQDTLGWDADVRFHPYWKDGPVRLVTPHSDRLLASAYSKDGKLLLAILNDSDEDLGVTLELDLEAMGLSEGLAGNDVFNPEQSWTLGPQWQGTVPARDFRLIPFN